MYVFTRAGNDTWTETKLVASDGAAGHRFGRSVAVADDTLMVGAPLVFGEGLVGTVYVFTRTDGIWTETATLSSAGAGLFGDAVAIDGETLIVGAPTTGDAGAAYVFERTGNTWVETAVLVDSDAEPALHPYDFGQAVAITGNSVVVGAPCADNQGTFDCPGAAYVFERTGDTWEVAKLVTLYRGQHDRLGSAVAIQGDTVFIGAPDDNLDGTASGAVYEFRATGDTWAETARLSDGGQGAQFGGAMALAGETLVIGAQATAVSEPNQGAVYLFSRTDDTWTPSEQLIAMDGAESDLFGASVAIAGDTLVVGAPLVDSGEDSNQGAAYVFARTPSDWTELGSLTPADDDVGTDFGQSVAIDGNAAVVGAPSTTVDGNEEQGAAHVFTRTDGTWSEAAMLVASDGMADDRFGGSVAIAGDTLVVGAALADPSRGVGAVYVFTRSDDSWTEAAKLTVSGESTENFFGPSVALAGNTIVVGVPDADIDGTYRQGVVYIFTRMGNTWTETAMLTASDGAYADRLGTSVARAGNTLVVGAPGADVWGGPLDGAVYVFTRTDGIWMETAKLVPSRRAHYPRFGTSVALDGNTVVVGTPNSGGGHRGEVYVFARTGDTWMETERLVASDGTVIDELGKVLALVGNTLVVGARDAAYVFTQTGETWVGTAKLSSDERPGFGTSVTLGGDIMLIGAPTLVDPAAYIFGRL